jgi:FkbM family methyltransferase
VKILGRPARRYVANLSRIHWHVRDLARAIRLFREPWAVLSAYVRRRPPAAGYIELRDGLRIHVSDDPLDVVTVVGIFVRRDYGVPERGSEVLDIGANIGVFTLFAVHCGAARVHAYEPSTDAFACLTRNVRDNRLEDRVSAFQVAVGAGPERTIAFPRKSSVFNSVSMAGSADCDPVELKTLASVLGPLATPHLIKLDCEGEEEFILASSDDETVRKLSHIRLEYHHGRSRAIIADLQARGFRVERLWEADEKGGLVWFVRDDVKVVAG